MGRPWFKHWNNSHDSRTLKSFIMNRDYECVATYWYVLELISRYENREEKAGEIKISLSLFCSGINMKPVKALKVLARFVSISCIRYGIETDTKNKRNLIFYHPKWLEFQEIRSSQNKSKTRAKQEHITPEERRKKREERYRNKDTENDNKKTPAPDGAESDFVVELNAIVERYPKREGDTGRAEGVRSLIRQIKSLDSPDLDEFKKAVENYAAHCEQTNIAGTKYVKQFSRFAKKQTWAEWVDYKPPAKIYADPRQDPRAMWL
jgi:hypothetical protein